MGEAGADGRALGIGLGIGLGLGAALLAVTAARLRAPPPARDDAPAAEFSAARAERLLADLAGDGQPRPAGSAAHARARHRVVSELDRLGWSPVVQDTFGCGRYGTCAPVKNVLGRRDGPVPGKAVLLLAHYDSVPAGPGASDDGAGVAAVLEVARALLHEPPRRAVILLLDDGEEGGLIGAAAFLAEHPWATEVGAVVNLEARGTSGPSILFQTSGEDAWLARLAGRALSRPVTSSLFAEIYRYLPNDTDLSLFQPLGVPGLDFAFVGDAVRYHTPRDDLAHVSRPSLQHHGENALAAVRALAASDLEHPPPGRAVFFDVLGLGVVSWPRGLAAWLALLAAALAGAGAWAARRGGAGADGPPGQGSALRGLAAFAAAPLAGGLLAAVPWLALRVAGALARPFVAFPGPVAALAWLCGACAAALLATALSPWAGIRGLRSGAALGWAAGAAALALGFPGASHLLLVPALAAGAAALAVGARGGRGGAGADLLVFLAAATVLFPVGLLLPDALGHASAPLVAALAALALWPLAPLAAGLAPRPRRALAAFPGAAAAAAALASAFTPPATPDRPEHVLAYFHQDADARRASFWVHAESGRLPEAMRRAGAFGRRAVRPLPWAELRPSFLAPAEAADLPPPELTVVEERALPEGRRRLRARLVSRRGAPEGLLLLPPATPVESLAMNGRQVPRPDPRLRRWFGGWQAWRCLALPPEGVEVELVLRGEGPVEGQVVDQSPGLPPSGSALLQARPPWAAPVQEGDSTLVTRRVRL